MINNPLEIHNYLNMHENPTQLKITTWYNHDIFTGHFQGVFIKDKKRAMHLYVLVQNNDASYTLNDTKYPII